MSGIFPQADTRAEVSVFEEIHTFPHLGRLGVSLGVGIAPQRSRRGPVAQAGVGGTGRSDDGPSLREPSQGSLPGIPGPASALPLAPPLTPASSCASSLKAHLDLRRR